MRIIVVAKYAVSVKLDRIKNLSKEHDLSISGLEDAAKLTNGTIGKWDKACPTIESLLSVADVLGIDFQKLIDIRKLADHE